jgi:hypothetical protein
MSSFGITENPRERSSTSLGFIDIVVESNVNRMLFTYRLDQNSLFLNNNGIAPGRSDTSSILIMVPVRDFQCGNPFGYKDFITLLKASQYPYMKIAIPRKAIFGSVRSSSLILDGVSLTVAGVSRNYDIPCNIEKTGNGNQLLVGTTMLRLTDLKIEPPVKSMGLVKIRNEIIVNFGFRITEYIAQNINK